MFEEKIINGEVVRRSKKWPNYGITESGKPYRWDTERLMKTSLLGGVGNDKYVVFRTCHNNIARNTYLHTVVAECWIENGLVALQQMLSKNVIMSEEFKIRFLLQ